MADGTHIEWTDATWNPITGCSVVSPGCTNCYAMKLAGGRQRHHPSRKGLTTATKSGPVWNGEVRFNEGWLDQPLRWKRLRRIFVCAHGDLFHEAAPDEWIDQVFAVMALCPHHTFQVLTKRPERMRAYLRQTAMPHRVARVVLDLVIAGTVKVKEPWPVRSLGDDVDAPDDVTLHHWPLPNVWLGVSVEDQARANERVPVLLDTPAAVRWISAEPLLGPIDLRAVPWGHSNALHRLDWVVVGGENGPRPMHPDWARSLRDQCVATGTSFLFKQWGAWLPWEPEHGPCWKAQNGRFADGHALFPADMDHDPTWDDGLWAIPEEEHFAFQRVGKKAAGRLLDGETWDQYPAGRQVEGAGE